MKPSKESNNVGRRSSSFFSRPHLSQLNTDVDTAKKDNKKLSKRNSVFGVASPQLSQDGNLSPTVSEHSPKLRPKTLQKGRPSSIFGSLGRKSTLTYAEEGDGTDGLIGTTPESPAQEFAYLYTPGRSVLHHGEVQTTSGMFRKKKEYLVLTDTHLVRFKSQSRAAEVFPSIPPAYGRGTRHPSTTSIGSLHEVQSTNSHASNENDNKIPLKQIVTAYKLEDGRPFFTTELVWLDEEYHGVGSLQLMLHDPKEADLWHTSLRGAAQKARLMMEEPFPERVVAYLVRTLEAISDYDPEHFQIFRIVKRAPKGGKTSSDDLQKLSGSIFYMVIGINRVHLLPLPDFTEPHGRQLASKGSRNVYGTMTLTSMTVNYIDDRFELVFRIPMQAPSRLEMAASATPDIATALVRSILWLKPQWLDYNFQFVGPKRLLEGIDSPPIYEEDIGGFDRTLVAYCMAYGVNPANVQYAVDMEVDDAPEFKLCQSASGKPYTRLELLAVLRSLRYNESFNAISFRGVNLEPLHSKFDALGGDHIAWTTRSGVSITKYFKITPQDKSLLYQEVQALALKSHRLQRLDFGYSLPTRRPKDTFDNEGGDLDKDPGTEIAGGLMPLCRGQLTNVDWIVLSGIELGETDFDDIIPALDEVSSGLRALECANCHLNDRGIMQLLGHMERQNATLEAINIADNPGKVHVERFQVSMSRFAKIRRLDLSRITKTFGDEPLFKPEVMLSWKLEELNMNGVPVNELTLESICTYLASPMSDSLRYLRMDQCNLNGSHIALLMRSMSRAPGKARNLHLSVSANRMEKGIRDVIQAIEENQTPAFLSIRMIEFFKEDHCKQFLQAVRVNKTLCMLDMSKASLPYDASDETCDALRDLFADNTTLEEFDISGEHAHLEVARFGIGLSQALNGLKQNTTLKVLRIEYQNLGLEGANTLSSVLEINKTLAHIYCEHNDINLQGFTTLVNSLASNHTILSIPFMNEDQSESVRNMSASIRDPKRTNTPSTSHPQQKENHHHSVKYGMMKTLGGFGVSKPLKPEVSPQDLDEFVKVLQEKWYVQNERMAAFLNRNRNEAHEAIYGPTQAVPEVGEDMLRPMSLVGEGDLLAQVLSNTTPKFELGNPVDKVGSRLSGLGISDVDGTPSAKGNWDGVTAGAMQAFEAHQRGLNEQKNYQLPAIRRGEKMFDLDAETWDLESVGNENERAA